MLQIRGLSIQAEKSTKATIVSSLFSIATLSPDLYVYRPGKYPLILQNGPE